MPELDPPAFFVEFSQGEEEFRHFGPLAAEQIREPASLIACCCRHAASMHEAPDIQPPQALAMQPNVLPRAVGGAPG